MTHAGFPRRPEGKGVTGVAADSVSEDMIGVEVGEEHPHREKLAGRFKRGRLDQGSPMDPRSGPRFAIKQNCETLAERGGHWSTDTAG